VGGAAVPPGFVIDSIDFQSESGQALVADAAGQIGRSIVYTPLTSSIMPGIMTVIMGGAMFMVMSNFLSLLKNGFGAITTAFSANRRLDIVKRLTMLAIGMGLFLFVAWRAQGLGMWGKEQVVQVLERPPVFFEVE
jgi:hypothetical protein